MPNADPYAPHEYAMMTFFNTHSKGLDDFGHASPVSEDTEFQLRKFKQGRANFDWYAYPFQIRKNAWQPTRISKRSGKRKPRTHAIGVYAGGGAFYLFLLRRDADLEELLPDISAAQRRAGRGSAAPIDSGEIAGNHAEALNIGTKRQLRARDGWRDCSGGPGRCSNGLLLNPASVHQVASIALGGDVLPQKSTDFYPKLMSGVAIFRVEGD